MQRRFGIRFKLLLVSLSLIAIPVAGYQFIKEMETFLRQAQGHNLATTTQALTLLVQNSSALPGIRGNNNTLYVHPSRPVIIDGYGDDWQELLPLAHSFYSPSGVNFQALMRESATYSYLFLQISNLRPQYIDSAHIGYGSSDQVEIVLLGSDGLHRTYLIAPRAPGRVVAYRLNDQLPGAGDFRLKGEWQEVAGGYNLELRIPRKLMEAGLSIDVISPSAQNSTPAGTNNPDKTWHLVRPSAPLGRILDSVDLPDSRIWITDSQGWVLAKAGALTNTGLQTSAATPWLVRKVLNLFLQHQAGKAAPVAGNSIHLSDEPVSAALLGETSTRRYRLPDSETLVIAAARPVVSGKQIRAVVMLEQTTGSILSLQNQAMQRLLIITFTLFVVVALALLGFASLLTSRIRSLHQQMEQAVAPDGRIIGEITISRSQDEIADLGRGFSSVLSRLQEYNRYLQAMAARLSHEFRTPLAIIRTSLENSAQVDESTDKQAYLARALKGVDRLELILRQLQEATRLEKALEQVEMQAFDVCELLGISLENYASIHPRVEFKLLPCTACRVSGSPELVHQALEKLLDNAVDFHLPQTPITLALVLEQEQAFLCVTNQGSEPPPNIDLFQSMVSLREKKQDQPHLGLGLYLVKLIAEFHNGHTRMENHVEEKTVSFCFSLKRLPT